MLVYPFSAFVNRLLERESWARERLQPYAKKSILIRAGLADLKLRIDDRGLLQPAQNAADLQLADLQLHIPPAAWLGLLRRDEAAMRAIRVEGDTELAQTVQELFLHLRWDVAEDLSQVVGDVAAQRMVAGGRAFFGWQRDTAQRLGENLAEYWREEARLLATRGEVQTFGEAAARLRDDLARLEKRIEKRATPRD